MHYAATALVSRTRTPRNLSIRGALWRSLSGKELIHCTDLVVFTAFADTSLAALNVSLKVNTVGMYQVCMLGNIHCGQQLYTRKPLHLLVLILADLEARNGALYIHVGSCRTQKKTITWCYWVNMSCASWGRNSVRLLEFSYSRHTDNRDVVSCQKFQ